MDAELVDRRECRRRTVVASVGAVAAMATAGCGELLGASSTEERGNEDDETGDENAFPITEDFENGYEGTFEDTGQSESTPRVTTERASAGSRALDLSASPGTSTRNSVGVQRTAEPPITVSVSINRYRSEGAENAAGVRLRTADGESDRSLTLIQSGYYGGVSVNEKNTDGDRISSQSIGDPPGDGTWYPMSLTIDTEGLITVSVAGETTDYDPGTDWRETELFVELSGNGWGNGHAVGVAFDQFSLGRP